MKTDTTEKGLETLIMRHMTGTDGLASGAAGVVADAAPATSGSGWLAGDDAVYDREFAVDTEQLFSFLMATQPEEWAKLGIGNYKNKEGMARQKFLARIQGEITRRGTMVEVQLNETETGRFVIEASSDFQGWTPLTTNRPIDGRISLNDPLATGTRQRIYRAGTKYRCKI